MLGLRDANNMAVRFWDGLKLGSTDTEGMELGSFDADGFELGFSDGLVID